MSFRARLTSFFLLIVVVPMAAVGFLVFRLIDDSQQGKASARINGIATTAANVYEQSSRSASLEARDLARRLAGASDAALPRRVAAQARIHGLARVTVTSGGATLADVGSPTAVAPGMAIVHQIGSSQTRTISLSALTAAQYASALAGRATEVVVNQGGHTLGSTLPAARGHVMPRSGAIKIAGSSYQAVTLNLSGFGTSPVQVTVLSDTAAVGGSVASDRMLAVMFIVAFLLLAVLFTLLASRALQSQLSRFLEAARRMGTGDFSEPIQTYGNDEFAALGNEFNKMSMQLAGRLDDLKHEQDRVRRSIRNIGEAFALNLDRDGLLQLALETAVDATGADRGRLLARDQADDPLTERQSFGGELDDIQAPLQEAEQAAEQGDGLGQASADEARVATVALGPLGPGGPSHGLISVCKDGREFTPDDLELLRSLATRATLALANVNLHFDVQRQAITDDLTGLATHGHFQLLLAAEMDEVRRYKYTVGLVMMDIDDFKSINDVHGHQQGDVVLQYVANVLRDNSRDVDVAARYGGEELSLILPHTDLDGTYVIAERVREEIDRLRIPLLDGSGALQITASMGVAAAVHGEPNDLIAAADGALYVAKRDGKNRTVKAGPAGPNVVGGRYALGHGST